MRVEIVQRRRLYIYNPSHEFESRGKDIVVYEKVGVDVVSRGGGTNHYIHRVIECTQIGTAQRDEALRAEYGRST